MTDQTELEAIRVQLAKLKRRQERNHRNAHAQGLLMGICSMLRPGDLVFDCGANVGAVTAELAKTGAEVHAFEPDPYAFGLLQQNTRSFSNVVLHQAAVGVASGTVRLMRADNFAANPKGASVKSTIVPGGRKIAEDEGETIDVEVVALTETIDALLGSRQEVAFVKMDIEGAELDLLGYMAERREFDRITLTVAETHEKKFKHLRDQYAALRDRIARDWPQTRVNLDWI